MYVPILESLTVCKCNPKHNSVLFIYCKDKHIYNKTYDGIIWIFSQLLPYFLHSKIIK